MTAKITKLTAEQEALLPVVRDEWIGHGLSTQPADREGAEEGVRMAYRAAGLEPPRFIVWLRSPLEGAYGRVLTPLAIEAVSGASAPIQVDVQVEGQVWGQVGGQVGGQVWGQVGGQVRDQVWDQVRGQVGGQVGGQVWGQVGGQVRDQVGGQVRDQVWDQVRDQVRGQVRDYSVGLIWGQHDAGWLSWLDAAERIGVTGIEPAHGLMQVARCSGWWWAYRDFAILTERPTQLHRDPAGRLHSESGPALSYPDGFTIHAWHGTRIEPWVIDPATTVEQVMAEPNAEVRRCAIEAMGWDRFEGHLHLVAECNDPGNPGQTLRLMDLPDSFGDLYDDEARILLCTNGTTEPDGSRRRFGLPVPLRHTDPVEAVAEMYDWPVQAYRQLARRT